MMMMPISCQNPFFDVQGCRALTLALARLSCMYCCRLAYSINVCIIGLPSYIKLHIAIKEHGELASPKN